jgi:hypothetical protein
MFYLRMFFVTVKCACGLKVTEFIFVCLCFLLLVLDFQLVFGLLSLHELLNDCYIVICSVLYLLSLFVFYRICNWLPAVQLNTQIIKEFN